MARSAPRPNPTADADLEGVLRSAFGLSGDDAALEERVLDAALDLAKTQDLRRTPITDIAEHAGVSRATVFRRLGGKNTIIERLVLREAKRLVQRLDAAISSAPDGHAGLVAAFDVALHDGATHPVLERMRAIDSRWLLRTAQHGNPSLLDLGRAIVGQRIAHAQAAGDIPDGMPPAQGADVMLHLLLGYVLVPGSFVDLHDPGQRRHVAEAAVRAICAAPAS